MTASLVQSFADPSDPIYAVSQGSMQVLPSDHVVLGYGSVPTLKEFNPNGDTVLSVSWGRPKGVQSYRVNKAPWVGTPRTKPDVAACREGNQTSVFMSWNGATEHEMWVVHGGAVGGNLTEVARVEKSGFETVVEVPGVLGAVRVEASGKGIERGVSNVVTVDAAC